MDEHKLQQIPTHTQILDVFTKRKTLNGKSLLALTQQNQSTNENSYNTIH